MLQFENSYKVKLVILIIAVHGLSLFLFTGMWDSLLLKNAFDSNNFSIVYNWFHQSGVPVFGYLHSFLGSFGFYPVLYKVLTLLLLIAIALIAFEIIMSLKMFSGFEAFAISSITIIYPVYSLWFDLVLFPLTVTYALYLGGLYIYLRFKKNLVWLFVSLVSFFLAFHIASFLVFHYGIMGGLFLAAYISKETFIENVFRFLKTHWVILCFPVIAFVLKSILFPTYGEYSGYNKIDINPIKIVEGLMTGVYNITIAQAPLVRDLVKYLPVVMIFTGIFIGAFYKNKPLIITRGKKGVILMAFSVALLISALLPYIMVYKIPSVAGYSTRHALLVSLPVALFIVGFFNCINIKWVKPVFILILILCASIQIRNKILWENRYIKYAAAVEFIRSKDPGLSFKKIIFDDKTHIGIKIRLAYYEGNWILKQATKNESNLGFDKLSSSNSIRPEDKTDNGRAKYMMSTTEEIKSAPLTLHIEPESAISNLAFFYNCKIRSRPAIDFLSFNLTH